MDIMNFLIMIVKHLSVEYHEIEQTANRCANLVKYTMIYNVKQICLKTPGLVNQKRLAQMNLCQEETVDEIIR